MEEASSSSMISGSFDHYGPFRANKRCRIDSTHSLTKFKGVVPQQNGHWGAQIYANHQRIWLGTFKSEKEAAMAYDSAAIKFRSGDPHRNFPWTERNIQEPNFQTQYSAEAISKMIRDGSYQPKYVEFLKTQAKILASGSTSINKNTRTSVCDEKGEILCMKLFHKELTPSDVGKLNRLVIPKKFAVKYFEHMSGKKGEDEDDIELTFYDKTMKCWKFRYCYWKSSQSFVFTRGWNRFVKEKRLKEKDIVTFYSCVGKESQYFSLINVNGEICVDGINETEENQKQLELITNEEEESKESKRNDKEKGLMLFGVQINL